MASRRDTAERLRHSVEALPRHTKLGMLQGIQSNRVIVGAYVDKRGGVCPMLAAHRNGGRTDFSTFARAWDAYTGARKPRRASAREVRTLKGYLEVALIREGVAPPTADWASGAEQTSVQASGSTSGERTLAEEVADVQASRRRLAAAEARDSEITIEELLTQAGAAAEEQRSEERAQELLGDERLLQPDRR